MRMGPGLNESAPERRFWVGIGPAVRAVAIGMHAAPFGGGRRQRVDLTRIPQGSRVHEVQAQGTGLQRDSAPARG